MKYEPPNYIKMYEAEKDAKEFYIKRSKEMECILRDQFAMAALTGVIAPTMGTWNANKVAQSCYLIADAMLKQREEGRDNE